MSDFYDKALDIIKDEPKKWLITGVAGFIGSNILEKLLLHNQEVIGIDNFSTGHKHNLEKVKNSVNSNQWENFKFHKADICDYYACKDIVKNIDYVLHQAALGSVPRSIANPILTNQSNISGFLNILNLSKEANVSSFNYAASSSTYGDSKKLPKQEDFIGKPLSPYAITKYVNELYAEIFSDCYGFHSIGLRYFNVFGKRQDPNGAYAAVIPKWISAMIKNEDVIINGDGTTSRDFCYIDNAVQANIIAALAKKENKNNVYNVAVGDRTDLNQLFLTIKEALSEHQINYSKDPIYKSFRHGDVKHSQADVSKAIDRLKYNPRYRLKEGIKLAVGSYIDDI